MLRKETVSESTLELLKTIMKDESLEDFFLVGERHLPCKLDIE